MFYMSSHFPDWCLNKTTKAGENSSPFILFSFSHGSMTQAPVWRAINAKLVLESFAGSLTRAKKISFTFVYTGPKKYTRICKEPSVAPAADTSSNPRRGHLLQCVPSFIVPSHLAACFIRQWPPLCPCRSTFWSA